MTITVTDSAGFSGTATFTWAITNTVSVTNPGAQSDAVRHRHQQSGRQRLGLLVHRHPGLQRQRHVADGPVHRPVHRGHQRHAHHRGSSTVTITVTDSAGFTGTATFTWTITNRVSVTNPGAQSDVSGSPIAALDNAATDSQSGATLTWSATGLPAGLSIDASTGTITGTPTTAGSSSVTVKATDGSGASGTATFTWTITNNVSVAPIANQSSNTGVAITPVTATATDSQSSPAPTITWSATGLPGGLSIGASSGTISGTPTTAGTSSVTVKATDGSGASGTATFTWTVTTSGVAPTITKIKPTSGPGVGGTKVRITGTHLNGATSVMFGSVASPRIHMNKKGTRLVAYSPAESAGTVDIIVTTPGGSSAPTSADRFTYAAATITSVSPSTGSSAGGTKVTIKGLDLKGATAVKFGTVSATSFTVNNDGKILTAFSPAESPGTVDIIITTPAGTTSPTPADQFVFAAPTVTGVSPSHGSVAGGTRVVITGSQLTGATAVKFGSVSVTPTTVNSDGTRVTVTSPAQSAGTVDVTVTTPGGTSAPNSADHYTYS